MRAALIAAGVGLAAGLVAAVVLLRGSGEPTEDPRLLTIDERAGALGDVALEEPEAEVRRVFGPPGEGDGFFPLGTSHGEVGGPPGVRVWPPDSRAQPAALRYEEVAFLVGERGVFAFIVTARGARTLGGVAVGDPLAKARDAYGAGCGKGVGGERLFGGVETYPYCRTTVDDRVRIWFGRDPIRSITVARVGAG